jgi:hypothetical protein
MARRRSDAFFSPYSLPMDQELVPVGVFRYLYNQTTDQAIFVPLPDLVCLEINQYEGARPWDATFRYRLDTESSTIPTDFESLMNITSPYSGVIQTDDRLVVAAIVEGKLTFLFDGYATVPELGMSAESHSVEVKAIGVMVRQYDRIQRWHYFSQQIETAFDQDEADAIQVTGRRMVFNKDGIPNASKVEADSLGIGNTWLKVFKEQASVIRTKKPGATVDWWNLSDAAAYIIYCGVERAPTPPDESEQWTPLQEFHNFVYTPNDFYKNLKIALDRLKQVDPEDAIDLDNPGTFLSDPIRIAEFDPNDMPWPVALQTLLNKYGYTFTFFLDNYDGRPVLRLRGYHMSDSVPWLEKDVYLQPYGAVFDPGKSNLSEANVQRDSTGIVNRWAIRTKPEAYLIGTRLYPGQWIPTNGDHTNKDNFNSRINPNASKENNYRRWIAGESGIPLWDWDGEERIVDWASVVDGATFLGSRRPRPAIRLDEDLTRLFAVVETAKGAGLGAPRTGYNFVEIKGGWRLLEDELGIMITSSDPNMIECSSTRFNQFGVGTDEERSDAFGEPEIDNQGKLNMVEWWSPDSPVKRMVYYFLNAVVESDWVRFARGDGFLDSPSKFPVERTVDGGQAFRTVLAHKSALFYDSSLEAAEGFEDTPGIYKLIYNVEEAEKAALSKVQETYAAPMAGTFRFPRITAMYSPGYRVRKIVGRNFDMASAPDGFNTGTTYPRIVQTTYRISPNQATAIQLTDRRGTPQFESKDY